MIISTIGDLFDGKPDHTKDHHIYVVRDGEVVFYVGRSVAPMVRLWQHLARGHKVGEIQGSESELGFLIKLMWPESAAWQIELLTIADCEPYIEWRRGGIIADCEQALIDCYRPCLNSIGNPHATPLPGKIEARRRAYFDYPLVIMPWDPREEK